MACLLFLSRFFFSPLLETRVLLGCDLDFPWHQDKLDLTNADFGSVVGFVDDIELTTQFLGFTGAAIAVVPLAEGIRFLTDNPTAGEFLSIDGIAPDDADQTDDYFFTRPLFQYYDLAETDNFATLDYLCALLEDEGQEILGQVGAHQLLVFVIGIR